MRVNTSISGTRYHRSSKKLKDFSDPKRINILTLWWRLVIVRSTGGQMMLMRQELHPVFGDLVADGVVALCCLFVLGLIFDAWWQKRQARLMRNWSKEQMPHPARSATPRPRLKRFPAKFALVALCAAVIVLVWVATNSDSAENNASGTDSMAAYATNFQGDATRPVPAAGMPHPGNTNLTLDQPRLSEKDFATVPNVSISKTDPGKNRK